MSRHYDVVVIGRSLGCLTSAALLARRDFRVLLLGQGEPPPSYRWEGRPISRRVFNPLFGQTPVWRRVLQDLAQTQTFRRRSTPNEPSYSLLTRRHRLELGADRVALAEEVRREFPEVQPLADELWTGVLHGNRALEAVLARDAAFPPEGLLGWFLARRWLGTLPWAGEALGPWLERFPSRHLYREAAFLAARFASDWAFAPAEQPLLSVARLQHHALRDSASFEGGEDAFEDFMIQRIVAHGGRCELSEKAEGFVLRGGRIAGVVSGGGEQTCGAQWVICGLPGSSVVELSEGRGLGPAQARWPELRPSLGRFVVSAWVRRQGLPEPLARHALIVPGPDARGVERPLLHLERAPLDEAGEVEQLVVEALVSPSQARRGPELRSTIRDCLGEQFPFLSRHLLLCDCPHDGLPLQLYEDGRERGIDRVHVSGAVARPEPLQPLWRADAPGFLGLAGEPMIGPVRGTLLVGKTVFPGLGQEGELLAAWNAAQRITRADRFWQKRRRQMWSKIDTE